MNKKFYLECLECPPDHDFKKVYIYFVPHYHFEGRTTSKHFEITVKRNPGADIKFEAEFYKDDFDDDEFKVDEKQNAISILRYVLGLTPYRIITKKDGTKEKVSINTITKNELSFLAEWVAKKRRKGHLYSVKT